MIEHKYFAKTVHIDKGHHGGLPRLFITTQANELIEIVMGEAQSKLLEAEIVEPCA